MKLLSVIIPVYNEEGNLELLFKRLEKVLSTTDATPEYIFINDGSRDHSMEIIRQLAMKDSRVKFIDFSRNFGHQTAVTAGLDYCNGDCAIIIDADLQDPPEMITELYTKWKEGFEVAYARRRSRQVKII